MATAVLRSHDALTNRMHLDAYTPASPSPAKPRRRRSPKPAASAASSSPPTRAAAPIASSTPPPKPSAVQKFATPVKGPAAPGRRSPPARPAASSRKQPSPTKEKPKQRLVMEEVRILKRGEEPPVPAPAPVPAPVVAAPPVAQAAVDQRAVLRSTSRIGPQAPAVVPTKKMVSAPAAAAANAAVYAGPAFSAAAPEPSSLPMPAFFLRRAESEATRGLRCLLRIGELA